MSDSTFGQAIQFLKIAQDQKLTRERFEALMRSGLLSKLLGADLREINVDAFNIAIGADMIIRVSRIPLSEQRCPYNEIGGTWAHPELAASGSARFSLLKFSERFRAAANNDWARGTVVYQHLVKNDLLKDELNLDDLFAIRAHCDVQTYRKHFGHNTLYAWKSLAKDEKGRLILPSLCVTPRDIFNQPGNQWAGIDDFDFPMPLVSSST